MSEIKKFLNRRAEGIAREQSLKKGKDLVHSGEHESHQLSDEEFWKILKQFKKECRSGTRDQILILKEILEKYSSEQVKQFSERYTILNS